MKTTQISVVMSVFNGDHYLKDAIDSILAQSFTNFEFIIVDDKSTDKSSEIISSYKDDRIRLIVNEKNIGLSASLNKAIELARGKYIARMDADDISTLNRFDKQYDYLERNPNVSLISSGYTSFKNGVFSLNTVHPNNPKVLRVLLVFCCPICHPALMARREIFINNKYDENVSAEDHNLWCRIIGKYAISNIDESLLFYRRHDNSLTAKQLFKIRRSTYRNGVRFFLGNFRQISLCSFSELKDSSLSSPRIKWPIAYIVLLIAKCLAFFNG